MERTNVVTLKGKPITLLGEETKVGQKAKDFKVLDSDLNQRISGISKAR